MKTVKNAVIQGNINEEDNLRMVYTLQAIATIMEEDSDTKKGIIKCPACKGKLHWIKLGKNNHIHGKCKTEGCLNWSM